MKKNLLLILTLIAISFSTFAEVKPWKAALTRAKGKTPIEPEFNIVMYGRYYIGSKSEIGFMHKIWDYNGATDSNAKTFFYNTPRHEEHQIVYYFNKKTGKHYAAIVEPRTQAAVALEFAEKQKALDIVFAWTYLKYYGDEKVNDCKINYLPVYGETTASEFIKYPIDYIMDFYIPSKIVFIEDHLFMNKEWHDLTEGKTWKDPKGKVYSAVNGELYVNGKKSKEDYSYDVNTTMKLEVIKDSEDIYNKIVNNGYFICDSCTKLNHGWTYVEVAGEHREFDNTDKGTWKKEIAKVHKVFAAFDMYSTFKKDY